MKLRAGMDVVYYGSHRQLEHDFIVAPGADDLGFGIAVDRKGNAYVAGLTFSTDFPSTSTIQPTLGGATFDAFVTKISANPEFRFVCGPRRLDHLSRPDFDEFS